MRIFAIISVSVGLRPKIFGTMSDVLLKIFQALDNISWKACFNSSLVAIFLLLKVNKDFVELEKEVKEIHPKLTVVHGGAEKTERVKPKPRVS